MNESNQVVLFSFFFFSINDFCLQVKQMKRKDENIEKMEDAIKNKKELNKHGKKEKRIAWKRFRKKKEKVGRKIVRLRL